MAYDDDDDWTGTPPEGRISRDRADPGFWQRQGWRFTVVMYGGLGILALAVLLIVLLS